jgi:hypothetical protein
VRLVARARARCGAAGAVLLAACAPRPPAVSAPHRGGLESSPHRESPAASSTIADTSTPRHGARDGDADQLVAAALIETSRVRELAVLGSVRGVTLSRKEMAVQVKRAIDREIPPDVVAAQGELLVALGVAPTDFDYVAALVSLMSSQLAGYYEPSEKTMYLASDLGVPERAATLSHELVHALQDQHYDLGKLLDYQPDASDAQTAVHALAEGDATSAMLDQLLASRGVKATDLSEQLLGVQVRAAAEFSAGTADVPDILKRSLVAPYVDGIGLVHFLRRRGGWAEVDRIWKTPPTSTEQLLHPEKLIAREGPIVVVAPPSPASGPQDSALTDVLGEQSVRLLLEEWLPRAVAEAAAAGWGGDRVAVFHADDRFAVAVHLRADSSEASARQAAGFLRGVAAQSGGTHGGGSCAERPDRGPLRVERRGRDVVIVAGPYHRVGRSVTAASSCAEAATWAARVFAAG